MSFFFFFLFFSDVRVVADRFEFDTAAAEPGSNSISRCPAQKATDSAKQQRATRLAMPHITSMKVHELAS